MEIYSENKVAQAKNVIENIVKEREWFLLLSKEFNDYHFIVLDDLERIKDSINFEEICGIIDELSSCNYVKVIVVANLEAMSESNKKIYVKYKEKLSRENTN